ncbi:hypothetical protein GCM10011575_28880 [Microlunatus endophyticus]|uniref:Pyridoxamine 5'-phosphate oxidase N-terminal domain-containing protein n=1 Tax=Microlunatus endophyticus TaxID=1716077 RepID=A0A917W665_9ACTN|nr:nitroreductase/quinone reductase family protein [Microlunatus endophyticus]GGL68459.1 hypothetical protein GCM10011575_28880 [Microlunatus endophyticus]
MSISDGAVPVRDAWCVWLTTLRRDGSAHTTPVWFLLKEDTFWIASSTVNVKVRNILQDPRVSIAVDGTGRSPVVAEGSARVHREVEAFPELIEAFAVKYSGWDATEETQDGPRVVLEVPVVRWLLGSGSG